MGDFNVITDMEEKLGGQPYNINKIFEFIGVIEACGLTLIWVFMVRGSHGATIEMAMIEYERGWTGLWLMIYGWKKCHNLLLLISLVWGQIFILCYLRLFKDKKQ